MQQEMERFLDYVAKAKRQPVVFSPPTWQPPIDVIETEDEIVVLLEIAGAKIDELEVQLDGVILVLRGRRTCCSVGDKKEIYHVMEIKSGHFERALQLPVAVDPDRTAAVYENGILQLTLPKVREPRQARIKIRPT